MLERGAMELVHDQFPALCSRLFLVEKATGCWRPMINLSPLNEYLDFSKFRMETVSSVGVLVRKGNFVFSLDLKEAYSQIPVHPELRL